MIHATVAFCYRYLIYPHFCLFLNNKCFGFLPMLLNCKAFFHRVRACWLFIECRHNELTFKCSRNDSKLGIVSIELHSRFERFFYLLMHNVFHLDRFLVFVNRSLGLKNNSFVWDVQEAVYCYWCYCCKVIEDLL